MYRQDIVLAEDVFDYFYHSEYTDLLDFERDLAELSALTIIFSESPGSIAELGSFAVLDTIRERLLVVMHKDHWEKKSFIWRGPILHIMKIAEKNGKDSPVTVYTWRNKDNNDESVTQDDFFDVEDLAETVMKILLELPKSESFSRDKLGHVMLLMLDLLETVQLASLDELNKFLEWLDIRYERYQLSKYLSLLKSLKLIEKKQYGHNVYYRTCAHEPRLAIAYRQTANVRGMDRDRWTIMFNDHYIHHNKQKYKALISHFRQTS